MEHRWSVRQLMEGIVTVSASPPAGRATLALRDISVGGLSLYSGFLHLPINCVVTLSFSLLAGGNRSHHRITSQVVYRHAQRTGLLFLDAGQDLIQAVRRLQTVRDEPNVIRMPVPARHARGSSSASKA